MSNIAKRLPQLTQLSGQDFSVATLPPPTGTASGPRGVKTGTTICFGKSENSDSRDSVSKHKNRLSLLNQGRKEMMAWRY